jgi:hypothetical protein
LPAAVIVAFTWRAADIPVVAGVRVTDRAVVVSVAGGTVGVWVILPAFITVIPGIVSVVVTFGGGVVIPVAAGTVATSGIIPCVGAAAIRLVGTPVISVIPCIHGHPS